MRALTFLLILAGWLPAQDLRQISLRTLCFKRVGDVKEVMLMGGSKEKPVPTPVPLYQSIYSDQIQAEVSGDKLTFSLPVTSKTGETVYKPVGEGALPSGNRLAAIFIPSGDADKPYKILVLDETEKAFPLGSTILVNLAPEPTRITLGEHDMTIPPGKMEKIPMATNVNDLKQATVRIFVPMEGPRKWRPVSSTTWRILPELRNLAIAYQNPKNGRTSVNCYQEVPPWRLPQFEEPKS
ncbi:hypothetical protein [Roseibacillus persicicus]|uniref:hypothetical protein n=1 Tax=Roseibacillus persicicus TaxID=454148 RepID=UPI00280D1AD5|nr:hypothetical protein [Roseibacillus persicicus]MDQ8190284.1 hypothetical protein [Roseibacillus persicicus]